MGRHEGIGARDDMTLLEHEVREIDIDEGYTSAPLGIARNGYTRQNVGTASKVHDCFWLVRRALQEAENYGVNDFHSDIVAAVYQRSTPLEFSNEEALNMGGFGALEHNAAPYGYRAADV